MRNLQIPVVVAALAATGVSAHAEEHLNQTAITKFQQAQLSSKLAAAWDAVTAKKYDANVEAAFEAKKNAISAEITQYANSLTSNTTTLVSDATVTAKINSITGKINSLEPGAAQMQEALDAFNQKDVEQTLYNVINTISGKIVGQVAYVQAVQTKYLVSTSDMQNKISAYKKNILTIDENIDKAMAEDKADDFLAAIAKIAENAKNDQKPYQDAYDAAKAAAGNAQTARTNALTAINELSVPSIKEEYQDKLYTIAMTLAPTSCEVIADNETIKANAEAEKTAI